MIGKTFGRLTVARKKAEIIRADALRDLIDFEAEIEKEMGLKGLSE